jgi:hypothetical protein
MNQGLLTNHRAQGNLGHNGGLSELHENTEENIMTCWVDDGLILRLKLSSVGFKSPPFKGNNKINRQGEHVESKR